MTTDLQPAPRQGSHVETSGSMPLYSWVMQRPPGPCPSTPGSCIDLRVHAPLLMGHAETFGSMSLHSRVACRDLRVHARKGGTSRLRSHPYPQRRYKSTPVSPSPAKAAQAHSGGTLARSSGTSRLRSHHHPQRRYKSTPIAPKPAQAAKLFIFMIFHSFLPSESAFRFLAFKLCIPGFILGPEYSSPLRAAQSRLL